MRGTPAPVAGIERLAPGDEATHLANEMYDRLLTELAALRPDEWNTPTVCSPWSVADVVRHLVGAAKGHASLREQVRQARHAVRNRGDFAGNQLDAMNALQVSDHANLSPEELLAELRTVASIAVAKRMSRPRFLHRLPVPTSPQGSTAPGTPDDLTLGHLLTVVLTRDVFLHRVDIARATGRDLAVDRTEGRLIADIVGEWAARHGEPFRLTLTGDAGGVYTSGTNGPELEFDALEFCWLLSGRGETEHQLFATRVFF